MENKQVNQEKQPLFKIRHLKKYFPVKKKAFSRQQEYVHANENITLDIYRGETLGLVGESGCGKSTLGRTILQIYPATDGQIIYYGATLGDVNPKYARDALRDIPVLYPAYKRDSEEFHALEAKAEKQVDQGGVDPALSDELLQKRRDMANKYDVMLRLAGGLLVHDDLREVSQLLLEELDEDAAYSEVKNRINELDLQEELSPGKSSKRTQELAELKPKAAQLKQKAEAKKQEVEKLRQSLCGKEGFEELEDRLDRGIDLSKLSNEEIRPLRKQIQIIFQDPYSSLDTRMTLGNIIGEGVIAHGMLSSNKSKEYNDYIQKVMGECGLAPYFIHRYPHQFSGGQRQRIGIARALAVQPEFIVCDEAVSALDVSIQSQVINLLSDLKEQRGLTYLFITHDLSVVKYISDRIAVMYLGVVVELADSDELFANPMHPYTQALLQAIPRTDVEQQEISVLEGDIPSAVRPPSGCRFHTRCKYCMDVCSQYEPEFIRINDKHQIACHLMDMPEDERKAYMAKKDAEDLARAAEADRLAHEAIQKI